MNGEVFCFDAVAPVRERGLKLLDVKFNLKCIRVAPVRERGLKLMTVCPGILSLVVAPVRERGLKSDENLQQRQR